MNQEETAMNGVVLKVIVKRLVCIFMVVLASVLMGCNSNDSSPSPDPDPEPSQTCEQVDGTWLTTETEDATNCGDGVYTKNNSYQVTQSGCNITVTFKGKNYSGTVDGKTIQWQGSFAEDGGTTTANISLTIDGTNLSGSSTWNWRDGTESCSGTAQISGTHVAPDVAAVDDQSNDPVSDGPALSGFGLELKEGDFWEYRWDDFYSDVVQSSGSSSVKDIGRFRITLGAPEDIDGITAYPLIITGKTSARNEDLKMMPPRWTYIAVKDNQILGTFEGDPLSVIFNAQTGTWPGGGFFTKFRDNVLTTATMSSINNNYINTQAYKIGTSSNKDQCEYFQGVGSICGDSSFNYSKHEYFAPNVGPVGYAYHNSSSDNGGGFYTSFTWTTNIGLVRSSLQGDTVDDILESEPNNAYRSAQALTNGEPVIADIDKFDDGTTYIISADYTPDPKIQDFFTISLPSSAAGTTVTITLDFEGTPNVTDLDLFLFNGDTTLLLHASIADNLKDGIQEELISAPSLGGGDYIIGVHGYATDKTTNSGRVEYTLKAEW